MTYPHIETSLADRFTDYVNSLPSRRHRSKSKDGWYPTQKNPCPLLYRCSMCTKYLNELDFYVLSSQASRKDALGTVRSSRCRSCHMESYFSLDPRVKLLNSARQRASQKNLEFTITVDDIKIPKHCPVLGIELRASVRTGTLPINKLQASPTIERIDNSRGYTPENVCVISHRANRLKCNGTLQELKAIVEFTERMMRERGLDLEGAKTSNTTTDREVTP